MKAKFRKTGEIVDIISYSGNADRNDVLDRVSYIDSQGIEHPREHLNFYWDFENVSDNAITDWEQRRYEIAKDILAMSHIAQQIGNYSYNEEDEVRYALRMADLLIKELKR